MHSLYLPSGSDSLKVCQNVFVLNLYHLHKCLEKLRGMILIINDGSGGDRCDGYILTNYRSGLCLQCSCLSKPGTFSCLVEKL